MDERYISIGEIEKAYSEILNEECEIDDDFKAGYQAGILAAMAVPAADVAPVVHGHWIICSDGYYPYCSVCKCEPKGREMTKFCGECGAKMDEEVSNDKTRN